VAADDRPRWRLSQKKTYSTQECADFIIRLLIDRVRTDRLSRPWPETD